MSTIKDPIHVLHVDDEPDFTEMATQFLTRHDDRFDVETVTSASDATDRLAENGYDCIVSDFDMPGQDGIEFLETVRQEFPDLPFILYTGKGSEEVASEAIAAGVSDYLRKKVGTSQYEVLANRIRNVVDQHRLEKEVAESEYRTQRLLEHSSDYLFVVDAAGKITYVSPSVERVLGYDHEEMTGKDAFDFTHPQDIEKATETFAQTVERPGEEISVEFRATHAAGGYRWLAVRGRNLLDDPTIEGILVNARDITERKERERELSEEKEKYSALVEQSHDGILVLQEGVIKFANEQAENILDFEEAELLGKPVMELVAPEDRERLQDRYQRRLDPETESPPAQYDVPFLARDGEQRYANISAAKIQFDGEPANLVTFRDVTERKERTRRLDTLINNLPGIVYRARNEPDWPMEFVEGACESLSGYSAEAVEEGETIWGDDVVHPEDQQEVWEAVQKSLEEERPFEFTYRIRTKGGTTKWVWERGQFVNTQVNDGQILEGFITGITEREQK